MLESLRGSFYGNLPCSRVLVALDLMDPGARGKGCNRKIFRGITEESIAIQKNTFQIGTTAMTLSPNTQDIESLDHADPGTAGESDSPVLEFDDLVERCMGNLDFVEKVLEKFEEGFPQQVEELESLLETRDADQLAAVAHRMKGNSANVSATGLYRVATEIEGLCRANRIGEIPARVDRLRREWDRYVDCSAQRLLANGCPLRGERTAGEG